MREPLRAGADVRRAFPRHAIVPELQIAPAGRPGSLRLHAGDEPEELIMARRATAKKNRWSAQVTRESNALDLEAKIFTQRSPRRIAASLKRSAERSRRRKAKTPYRSAMSMLVFYINRA